MIPDVSRALVWLKQNLQVLKGIRRGLERETLRIDANGSLATTTHPELLGSALTHRWITTDFAEALLEFITPVDDNIERMLTIMRDIHRYVARNLGNERMWPFSMPCDIKQGQDIKLAQYGNSNIGRLKALYREGLKNRYGIPMQIISGIHYNFSLPVAFWQAQYGKVNKEIISASYCSLIRNYYRFGWVVPYLFGSSPAICSSFLQDKLITLPFEKIGYDIYYLPYSTSLRLSDLGYTNKLQNKLCITFNALNEYLAILRYAVKTPSEEYEKIGLKKNGKRLQINNNILQIENELYIPIRPKSIALNGETPSDALQRSGIEYIEIRSLDINSFSPIGINEQQIRFLDLFIIWCALVDAPIISSEELVRIRINWNRVILEGRKPGLKLLSINHKSIQYPLSKLGKDILHNLKHLAEILDNVYNGNKYQKVCDELIICFDNPELTFSAKILRSIIDHGINGTGCALASIYRDILRNESLEIMNEVDFAMEYKESIIRQREIEASDNETFEAFLANRNNKIT